jgi:hypothetical protein
MLLKELVSEHGSQSWKLIAGYLPGRSAEQCKQHWIDVLDPSIQRAPWSAEEDCVIIEVCTTVLHIY